MLESEINISHTSEKTQYQEWVARFCYASAKLPAGMVEHFLDLMESCGESKSLPLRQQGGRA